MGEEASDKQRETVKRFVASKKREDAVNWGDYEWSDEEENPELFHSKTGKKLTFNFPDTPAASSSARGRGRARKKTVRVGGKKKDEDKGEKQKGKSDFNVEAAGVMEIQDGEMEKNPPQNDSNDKQGDVQDINVSHVNDEENKETPTQDDDVSKGEKQKNPPKKG